MLLAIRWIKQWGKSRTYLRLMRFGAVTMTVIRLLPPGRRTLVLILGALAGLGDGAANAIPWVMVADVSEEDEWQTGLRRVFNDPS